MAWKRGHLSLTKAVDTERSESHLMTEKTTKSTQHPLPKLARLAFKRSSRHTWIDVSEKRYCKNYSAQAIEMEFCACRSCLIQLLITAGCGIYRNTTVLSSQAKSTWKRCASDLEPQVRQNLCHAHFAVKYY